MFNDLILVMRLGCLKNLKGETGSEVWLALTEALNRISMNPSYRSVGRVFNLRSCFSNFARFI